MVHTKVVPSHYLNQWWPHSEADICIPRPQCVKSMDTVPIFRHITSKWRHLYNRTDSRFAPSQWEMSLQSNAVSNWLGANPESALIQYHSSVIHYALKTESCHDADFAITGSITGCHNGNLWCCQWRQSWHHVTTWFSWDPQYMANFSGINDSIMLQCMLR